MHPDWTISVDSILREKEQYCTLCGKWFAKVGGSYVWDTRQIGGLAIGAVLCSPCARDDPERIRRDALLTAR